MRIVILSDTHGLLRPEVLAALENADAIVHGGDINTQAIVDTLKSRAPLYIVRGNNDKEWAEGLPHDLRFTLAAHRDGCVGMAANMIGVSKRVIKKSRRYR